MAAVNAVDAALQGSRKNVVYQVVLGPYVHAESGTLLQARLGRLALEWFDTWLKGRRTGMADTPTPLHAYELEGGRWTDTTAWPPPTAHARTLYFGEGGSGSGAPSRNDGTLADAPGAAGVDSLPWNGGLNSPCSRQTYQQANEFIFVSSNFDNPCFYDDRTFEAGGLTYTTAPLAHSLDLAGPGDVTIYARANKPNIELPGTVARIARGDRLRITVQSSDVPYLEPTFPDQSQLFGGSYQVARGGAQPSSVTLPVLEPGDLATSPVDWGPCPVDCGSRDASAGGHAGVSSGGARIDCRPNRRLALPAPHLRRGEHVRHTHVWLDGHRARVVRRRGRFLVAVRAVPVRLRVVWSTTRHRVLTRRRLVARCP